jgi:DNA-binding CsgD family transcriptional regulator
VDDKLIGRDQELARIARLVDDVRGGASDAMVLSGEPGIGKSALLVAAVDAAHGFEVVMVRGIESEVEIAFGGLLELLRPLLGRVQYLSAHLKGPLDSALALGPPAPVDPLVVGVATLSVMTEAAKRRPLLAVVDDAHWVDAASAQALLFTARRLGRESVGILLAVRDGADRALDTTGLETLDLKPLRRADCDRLVARSLGSMPPGDVLEAVFEETAGNPLAVIEAAANLTDDQRTGRAPLEHPLRAGERIEASFRRRIDALDPPARFALLAAAACGIGDTGVVGDAVERAGHQRDDLLAAEAAGLIAIIDGQLEFIHPLIRSVAYHTASPEDRRKAHRGLSAALEDRAPEEAVWHAAAAAVVPDEDVAAALESAAQRALSRGGAHAATRALERAARLSPDRPSRARRFIDAAAAARQAGDLSHCIAVAECALQETDEPRTRALANLWRGTAIGSLGSVRAGMELLISEAALVEEIDPELAARLLVQASVSAERRGELLRARDLTLRAYRLAGGEAGRKVEPAIAVARWRAAARVGGGQALVPELLRLLPEVRHDANVATPTALGECLRWLEHFALARELLTTRVEAQRRAGTVVSLPYTLGCLSEVQVALGELQAALAHASEATQLARDTRQEAALGFCLTCMARVEAIQGSAEQCRRHVAEAQELGMSSEARALSLYAGGPRGLLELGLGRIDDAIAVLEPVAAGALQAGLDEPNVIPWQPDLIEAYARAGRSDDARREHRVLQKRADATGGTCSRAVAARSAALVAGPDGFDDLFAEALGLHQRQPLPFELARTELCWGERQRRAGLRRSARAHLGRALAMFEELGAVPWADRTQAELSAAGQRRPATSPGPLAELTPHERQVVSVVAGGASNEEASAELFLSVKTIEKHLTSAYRKLGVRSRSQLAALLINSTKR